ncbi:MAG TPA: M1 family metallopeptidase [Flavisolibacter sp.]
MKKIFAGLLIISPLFVFAQSSSSSSTRPLSSQGYWQQRVKYDMDIDVNVVTNRFTGRQKLQYWNNSHDTLRKVYYHLFWNAFQPGSMMDVRSRRQGTVAGPRGADWDSRVRDRISKLTESETGYQKVLSLKMNGRPQSFKVRETILEVILDKPILPHSNVTFDMNFEAQVPIQIRRSGRDNAEGVRFSMSQWYPRMAEYDKTGWHPDPYIGREFYGVWGDFDVKIKIDKKYVVGGTGYLQNPNQVGYGYETTGSKVVRPSGEKLTWHFRAPNVHDFVWAADPEYIHLSKKVRDGLVLHALYKIDREKLTQQFEAFSEARKKQYDNKAENFILFYQGQWEDVLEIAALALPYIEKNFGAYAYQQYSFIQGGDGGMEYPMATLLKGAGPDVVIHEWMHSWYQMMLATNENLYAWMDEGFTSFAESKILAHLTRDTGFAQRDNYAGYYMLAKSPLAEPLSVHANHYNTNYAYSSGAYSKGAVFVEQLGYITGADVRDKILLDYYHQWRFRHPDVHDFIRVAEKVSQMELDWYRDLWINTTKTIDYSIDSLWQDEKGTNVRLNQVGQIPMPLDVKITFNDGTSEWHYIPLDLTFGIKPAEEGQGTRKVYEPWRWTDPQFVITTTGKLTDIRRVEIDPSMRMADVERKNNRIELKWQ